MFQDIKSLSLCVPISERIPDVEKPPFPLLKLPNVPLELVTKMMHSNEIIKLSICSYRLELFLNTHRYKIRGFHVHLGAGFIQFNMNESAVSNSTFFKNGNVLMPIEEIVRMEQFCKSETCEKNNYFQIQSFSPEACFKLYHRIRSLFSYPLIGWIFHCDQLEDKAIKRYLDTALSEEYYRFSFKERQLSKELLTEIMNKLPLTIRLEIDSGIPLDFKHHNAFKYPIIEYNEARWATLDDLKSVRNACYIELKSTNFDYFDLNQFLKYWVDCEENMTECLTIGMREGLHYDVATLTDGLITLNVPGVLDYYLKVKNTANRTLVLAHFWLDPLHRFLFDLFPIDCRPTQFALLEMLERRKELEEELMGLGTEGIRLEQSERRKTDIRNELERLDEEIIKKDTIGYVYNV
ncbi:hypothetical protein CRE_14996 [Caenorhabditis remanei]|uniref:Sdz-33 F-box domain-containing protein n=1 Tax=Caenorhabditis remanei TaxID=31234 RepID=E3NH97_CAERE|nr:hypothetical protein CRE_14996 [Caenorhabditis remanei]